MTDMPLFFSAQEVYRRLDYDGCIGAMRDAMASLSRDGRDQPLRQIAALEHGKIFGTMPGFLPEPRIMAQSSSASSQMLKHQAEARIGGSWFCSMVTAARRLTSLTLAL